MACVLRTNQRIPGDGVTSETREAIPLGFRTRDKLFLCWQDDQQLGHWLAEHKRGRKRCYWESFDFENWAGGVCQWLGGVWLYF